MSSVADSGAVDLCHMVAPPPITPGPGFEECQRGDPVQCRTKRNINTPDPLEPGSGLGAIITDPFSLKVLPWIALFNVVAIKIRPSPPPLSVHSRPFNNVSFLLDSKDTTAEEGQIPQVPFTLSL